MKPHYLALIRLEVPNLNIIILKLKGSIENKKNDIFIEE